MDHAITRAAGATPSITPLQTSAAARTWSILLTSENHGTVGPVGCAFPWAGEKHERVLVVEVPAAAGAPSDQVNLKLVPAPSAPVGAVPSIDTPKFHAFMNEYDNEASYGSINKARANLIAHIDQHVASQVRAARDAQRPTDDHLWNETIRDRDTYHEWADKLAEAISKHFGAYIGEHSNANCPWAEALEAIESAPAISHSGEGEKGGAA